MSDFTLGVPKERLANETRVALVPADVRVLARAGIRVLVERGAGEGIGISDRAYESVRAVISSTKPLWSRADYIVKYKPPLRGELSLLRPQQLISAIFHAEGDVALTRGLCARGVEAYSYEYMQNVRLDYPAAHAGGEIAGRMAVLYGSFYLQRHLGGSGILLAGIPGAPRPLVVIIGHGKVGGAAARAAHALGARVVVLGRNREHLRTFAGTVPPDVVCHLSSAANVSRYVSEADLVIGGILISTFDTPTLISAAHVKRMKPGSVIVDATAGYGPGYIETFRRNTTLENPVFREFGVLHIKIDNFPSAVPVTSSHAFSSGIVHLVKEIALSHRNRSPLSATAKSGLIVKDGAVVHPEVARHIRHSGVRFPFPISN